VLSPRPPHQGTQEEPDTSTTGKPEVQVGLAWQRLSEPLVRIGEADDVPEHG
jgi:hypothetical protein